MAATTEVSQLIRAPQKTIYEAFLDPARLAQWRAPTGMKAHVHSFDPREGGAYRLSLTYTNPESSQRGKTTFDTDTFQGRFLELAPYERIVEAITFESSNPGLAGVMIVTSTFALAGQGTEVTVICANLPPAIRPEDNELGCRLSLQNLARLVE
ncbi:MAG TPA: SRPBCC family protein [Edaphobacter sp.]|jgi:uncharacterized protein YndB with AHSA1/START domain|nr:SRPBCC family protein [Edaphobacter sp.]